MTDMINPDEDPVDNSATRVRAFLDAYYAKDKATGRHPLPVLMAVDGAELRVTDLEVLLQMIDLMAALLTSMTGNGARELITKLNVRVTG